MSGMGAWVTGGKGCAYRLELDAEDVLLSRRPCGVCASRCLTLRSWYHIRLKGASRSVHMITHPWPNPVGSSWSCMEALCYINVSEPRLLPPMSGVVRSL